jgi:GNAT superfamily N-acetyltransferase
MISIRAAAPGDSDFLGGFELTPNEVKLREAMEGGNIQIALADEAPVGFMCFSVLWGTLPLLEFFEIVAAQRGRRLGTSAVRAWEQAMKDRGFDLVLTSTGADAGAQHFWRKMGYVDCGALTVRGKAAEVFFQRAL